MHSLVDRLAQYLAEHVEDDTLPVGWPAEIALVVFLIIVLGSFVEVEGWINLI